MTHQARRYAVWGVLVTVCGLQLMSSCAQPMVQRQIHFAPPATFITRAPRSADLAVALICDFDNTVSEAERLELTSAAERGVVEGLLWRGYKSRVVAREGRVMPPGFLAPGAMDSPDTVFPQREWALARASAAAMSEVMVVHFEIGRTTSLASLRGFLGRARLEGHFTVYAWDASSLLFYRPLTWNDDAIPVVSSKTKSFDGRRESLLTRALAPVTGYTNTTSFDVVDHPLQVWGEQIGRTALAKAPSIAPLRPNLTEPAGFTVPFIDPSSPAGAQYASIGKSKVTTDYPAGETSYETFQDRSGNLLGRVSTSGVVWGWEVEPVASRAYLLVDPSCSGKPTERWPTSGEALLSPPACARKGGSP
jgi:hypothetical protein